MKELAWLIISVLIIIGLGGIVLNIPNKYDSKLDKISTNISLQNCQLVKYIEEPHGKTHDYFILITKDNQEYKLQVSGKDYDDIKEIYDSAKILGHVDELKVDVIANLLKDEVCAIAFTKNRK